VWARGSVVGWSSMLEAGSSRVRFPMSLLNFFNVPNPSSPTITLEVTDPLTEMSTRNLRGGLNRVGAYGWQLHRYLWADCLENVGSSTSHNPMGLHDLLQGYLYFLKLKLHILTRSVTTQSYMHEVSRMFPSSRSSGCCNSIVDSRNVSKWVGL
jgi:hypothetical protein